jgi:NADH dehydrogenase
MVNAMEYAGVAERWGFTYVQGELADIDPDAHRIRLAPVTDTAGKTMVGQHSLDYDILVLALGGVTPDLGVEGVDAHACLLDYNEDADALYSRLSTSALAGAVGGEEAMHAVIVGSGLTGVELAAYLVTDAQPASVAPRSTAPAINVTLVEALDQFMPSMGDYERNAARKRLEKVGVTIRTGCQISKIGPDHVETGEGERIDARLTVWATGRVGPPVAAQIEGLEHNKKRQWRVRETLQTLAHDDIFALGDCAYVDEAPAPPTAQVASEQAGHLAAQLPRYAAGQTLANFEFQDKGTLMSLGAAGAVGRVRGLFGSDIKIHGKLAAAAYRGLERQHEMVVLGRARGYARLLAELFTPSHGPRIKVH